MKSNLSQGEILQIFGIVLAIGRSKHYSISFDYDSEFESMELRLWHSPTDEAFDIISLVTDKSSSFAEIVRDLKRWTKIIVTDRGEAHDNTN